MPGCDDRSFDFSDEDDDEAMLIAIKGKYKMQHLQDDGWSLSQGGVHYVRWYKDVSVCCMLDAMVTLSWNKLK